MMRRYTTPKSLTPLSVRSGVAVSCQSVTGREQGVTKGLNDKTSSPPISMLSLPIIAKPKQKAH